MSKQTRIEADNMQAFNNDHQLKAGLLAELEKHRLADQVIQGDYGDLAQDFFQGCAVGCSIHSYALITGRTDLTADDHSVYEQFGIPRALARLEDAIFEGLPTEESKQWPERFMQAINVGSDLTAVWPQFAQWLLTDKEYGVIRYAKTDEQRKVIQRVSDLYGLGDIATREEFEEAQCAAAADAVDAVDTAATHAASAASAAAYAATHAVDAAAYAATHACVAADAATATTAYAARQKMRIAQANKLIELLAECAPGE